MSRDGIDARELVTPFIVESSRCHTHACTIMINVQILTNVKVFSSGPQGFSLAKGMSGTQGDGYNLVGRETWQISLNDDESVALLV